MEFPPLRWLFLQNNFNKAIASEISKSTHHHPILESATDAALRPFDQRRGPQSWRFQFKMSRAAQIRQSKF